MIKNFRTSIVDVLWKKVGGLLRIAKEIIQNIERKLHTNAHAAADVSTRIQQQIKRRK